MNAPAKSTGLAQMILLLGFATLLCAPIAGWIFHVAAPGDMQEMRPLADWPDWHATSVSQWPLKFEAWLNDHFALRGQIVRAHSTIRHRWLAAPSNNVVVGRDGWLFYTGDQTVEDLLGHDALSQAQLAQWRAVLEGRQAWLRTRGITYLFVIAPNKPTIYPEKLPAFLYAHKRPGKTDQLLAYLAATRSTVPVLDLRPTLFALKSRQLAYWPTDSHWNGFGIATACDAIMGKLRALGVATDSRDLGPLLTFNAGDRLYDAVDLLAMRNHWPTPPVPELRLVRPADLHDVASPLANLPPWKDAQWWKKPITTERESGVGRAVLFCDSFFRSGGVPLDALGQTPFLLRFRRFTSLWEWPDHEMLRRVVEEERPEIIIEARVERYLKLVPADDPELALARAAASR